VGQTTQPVSLPVLAHQIKTKTSTQIAANVKSQKGHSQKAKGTVAANFIIVSSRDFCKDVTFYFVWFGFKFIDSFWRRRAKE
jgi:putative NIF3 family GTP cyclohydrolase 1 type 2